MFVESHGTPVQVIRSLLRTYTPFMSCWMERSNGKDSHVYDLKGFMSLDNSRWLKDHIFVMQGIKNTVRGQYGTVFITFTFHYLLERIVTSVRDPCLVVFQVLLHHCCEQYNNSWVKTGTCFNLHMT